MFPAVRLRRLRKSESLRALVRETEVSLNDLVYPLFVVPGNKIRREISSLPGNCHLSIDELAKESDGIARAGIRAVLLFGLPESKDEAGSGAYADNGIVQQAIRELKRAVPELLIVTDVCLCEYTSHGHCGVVVGEHIDNDLSLELIAKTALSHAEAGADIVAPSDMMDGRVSAIRALLDECGFDMTPIMSYAAKYASAFYGPFRDAVGSAPQFGDRRSYQMDPANAREALREVRLDIAEGADFVMVKPALAYLDIIRRVREECDLPLAAYNVSGEFAMVKAAAAKGLLDEKRSVMEIMNSIKRAGADIIITYHAKDVANWLTKG